MNASRKIKLSVLTVATAALAAGGTAYAAAKHGQPRTQAAGLSPGFVGARAAAGASGPACDGVRHGPGGELEAAAAYLGLSSSALRADLEAGQTLGQVADATAGKSKEGLVAALVAHEQGELARAVDDGKLTKAEANEASAGLADRIASLVEGVRPAGRPGFGPPGASGMHRLPGPRV